MVDLTKLIEAVLGLLAALITYMLIPWIKSRTDAQQQASMRAAVKVAVFAAEQIYGAGNGEYKFQYACEWLKERGFNVSKTEVEAAVYEFINALEEKPPEPVENTPV